MCSQYISILKLSERGGEIETKYLRRGGTGVCLPKKIAQARKVVNTKSNSRKGDKEEYVASTIRVIYSFF